MAHALHFPRGPRPRFPRGLEKLAAGGFAAVLIIGLRLLTSPPETAEAAAPPPPVAGADIVGSARVIDGDGLWVQGVEIRLHGIDAFELRQTCGDVECGLDARRALHRLVADRPVACRFVDQDRYGRQVSTCSVDGADIGAALVRQGHALAYTTYSNAYVGDENAARAARAGAWAGDVTPPSDWRRRAA